uniref:Uncharacterized protein n=1 Tax=Globodera rostochiensis TaxID=31243 RepID=A0A914HLS3_GLORO
MINLCAVTVSSERPVLPYSESMINIQTIIVTSQIENDRSMSAKLWAFNSRCFNSKLHTLPHCLQLASSLCQIASYSIPRLQNTNSGIQQLLAATPIEWIQKFVMQHASKRPNWRSTIVMQHKANAYH